MHPSTSSGNVCRSRHRTRWTIFRALALFLSLLVISGCSAQAGRAKAPLPQRKTITWIVPYEAGGNTDAISRTVADAMSRDLGQKIVVENKPGGSGAIGMQNIRAAKPDGYTIGLFTSGTMVVSPLANQLDYTPHSFTTSG